jgi:hypothetical protein
MKHNSAQICYNYSVQVHRTTGKPMKEFVTYNRGWYETYRGKKFRAEGLIELTEELKHEDTAIGRWEVVNGVKTWIDADKHVVQSVVGGKDVIESRDTPYGSSVSDEAYWSM